MQGKPLEKLSSNWSRRDEEYIGIMQKKADLFFLLFKKNSLATPWVGMGWAWQCALDWRAEREEKLSPGRRILAARRRRRRRVGERPV